MKTSPVVSTGHHTKGIDQGVLDWLKRLGLRWVTLYLVFYIVVGSQALTLLPGLRRFGEANFGLWRVVVPWVGEHVLHLAHTILPVFNSSDALFDYVEAGSIFVLALVGAILWTCLDHDRQRERVLHEATRILVRYTLAAIMFWYGFSKVLHQQMPYPGPSLLMTPFGALEPVALMWAFMGYSTIYSLFAGLAELIGGTLLLFRRTTTLGALVIAGVMTNVVVMNVSFDLAVRLWASQLVFMAIFLLVPDMQRLANALVLYRSVPAVDIRGVWPKGWMGSASLVLKVLVIGWILYNVLAPDFKYSSVAAAAHKIELVGLYRVERFRSTDKSDASLVSGGKLWQRVAIEGYAVYEEKTSTFEPREAMTVRTADDAMQSFQLQVDRIDATHGRLWLTRSDGHSAPIVFRYVVVERPAAPGSPTRPSNEVLALDGTVDGAPISMRLDRLDTSNFELMSHRFQWIIDAPFSRY